MSAVTCLSATHRSITESPARLSSYQHRRHSITERAIHDGMVAYTIEEELVDVSDIIIVVIQQYDIHFRMTCQRLHRMM